MAATASSHVVTASEPRSVTKFEARLLTIERAILRVTPLESALPQLMEKLPAPGGLSADCLELVCDGLANGCVAYLAQVGGWRRERFLRGGAPVDGRLWDRSPIADLKLSFSQHSIDWLVWLTVNSPLHSRQWSPPGEELTIADRLLLFLSYDVMRGTEAGLIWRSRPVFATNLLCRLAYPEDFAEAVKFPPAFSGWADMPGCAILEALEHRFAERWLAVERTKRAIGDWRVMRTLADGQDMILDGYMTAIDAAGRRDLSRFLLRAAAGFCKADSSSDELIAGLRSNTPGRLAERYDVQRRSATLARAMQRLNDWQREARGVGYLDEGYAAAQMFKSDWERFGGDDVLANAQRLLRQLEPVAVERGEAR